MAFRIGAANPSSLKLGNFSVSVIFIFTTLQGWALSEGDAAGPNKEMGGDYTHWASFVAKNVIVIAAISEVFRRVGLHGLLLDALYAGYYTANLQLLLVTITSQFFFSEKARLMSAGWCITNAHVHRAD